MKTIDTANELLGAIDILVNQAIRDNSTQIYNGVCKSITNTSTCVMTINGKDNNVKFYGVSPNVGGIYRVFVPNGNMSMAFIITIVDNPGAIGAAPAGFGLGGIGKRVTDMNNAQESGFYSAIGASNLPPNVESVQYGSVLVLCSQADRVTQVYFHDVTGGTGAIAVRRLNGNGWSAWEFINPPMQLGVEYRTTERYYGKPVYKKLMNVGSVGPSSSITINDYASNVRYIVEYNLYSQYAQRAETRDSELFTSIVRPKTFTISNKSTSYTYSYSLFYIAYTKSTD